MMVRREERNKEAFFFSIFVCIFGRFFYKAGGVFKVENPNPNHTEATYFGTSDETFLVKYKLLPVLYSSNLLILSN